MSTRSERSSQGRNGAGSNSRGRPRKPVRMPEGGGIMLRVTPALLLASVAGMPPRDAVARTMRAAQRVSPPLFDLFDQ
jgi:hypothetical protein